MTEEKQEKIANFDPDNVGLQNGNLYGLPFNYEESEAIVIPVPWDVTVSYRDGASRAPAAVLKASPQIDFYNLDFPEFWKEGIFMLPIDRQWKSRGEDLRYRASSYIEFLEAGGNLTEAEGMQNILTEINNTSIELKDWVKDQANKILDDRKFPIVLGGDHGCPLGLIEALTERHESFGILHIDAHADLRRSFEGMHYSHASIMHNVLQFPQVSKIVSLGVRDICHAELEVDKAEGKRVALYFDQKLKERVKYTGQNTWSQICDEIALKLPQKVYISFDVDGLDPKYCPNTGTPVIGGLEAGQVFYLIKRLIETDTEIIGCDLSEINPGPKSENLDSWDSIVGMRLLYQLAALGVLSRKS